MDEISRKTGVSTNVKSWLNFWDWTKYIQHTYLTHYHLSSIRFTQYCIPPVRLQSFILKTNRDEHGVSICFYYFMHSNTDSLQPLHHLVDEKVEVKKFCVFVHIYIMYIQPLTHTHTRSVLCIRMGNLWLFYVLSVLC